MASQYTIDYNKLIGHGHLGLIYQATNRAGIIVAVKIIRYTDHDRTSVDAAERDLRLPNEHPNIIDIYDVENEPDKKFIYMEFCELGNLRRFFLQRDLTLGEKLSLMCQIAAGIDHLHAHGIIHRDITPENILVQRRGDGTPEIKLSDFGVSKYIQPGMESTMTSDVGSSSFKAPEFWKYGSDGRLHYKKSVDVFAMGLTFLAILQADEKHKSLAPDYEVLDGLDNSDRAQPIGYTMYVLHKNNQPLPEIVSNEGDLPSRQVRALIRKMLQFDPDDRISVDKVRTTLAEISA